MTATTTRPSGARRRRWPLLASVIAIGLLLVGPSITPAQGEPVAPPQPGAVPQLAWQDCGDGFQCSRAQVPLDHDVPDGETIELSLIRLPASDPARRIGSLFTNPGGPGLSGVAYVRSVAQTKVPEQVRQRFDIIGLDPRGAGESTPVRCFDDVAAQSAFYATHQFWPVLPREERPFVQAQQGLARECAARNGDLLDHLSTADVARDLDLLRAAVGEDQLTFLGLSYGTYLGITYASLFPDRVRAMVLDGVIDPMAYTGTEAPARTTPWLRSGAHLGSQQTLEQFLQLCAEAGPRCPFGIDGDPATKYHQLVDTLTDHPLQLGTTPPARTELTADVVMLTTLADLYEQRSWVDVATTLQSTYDLVLGARPPATPLPAALEPAAPEPAAADGYDNSAEAQLANICVDTENPVSPYLVGHAADRAEQQAPDTADRWSWRMTTACTEWAGSDEDRYTGPFTPQTANPLLVVGTRYDPATPYENAERLAADLPAAGLLTLEGWGHTASFRAASSCIDDRVADYLLTTELPPAGTTCRHDPDAVPFATPAGPS